MQNFRLDLENHKVGEIWRLLEMQRYDWHFGPNQKPWLAYSWQGKSLVLSLNLFNWHFTVTGIRT